MKKKVVVIGSGLAGVLLCNELVKSSDVTLLELGEKDKISYPKIHFVKKTFAAVKTFCIGGGGTTNLWHNGLIPINSIDVESKEFNDVLIESKSYMDRAAARLYFKSNSYSDEYNNVISYMNSISEEIGVFADGVDSLLYPKKYKKLEVDPGVNALYSVVDIDFSTKDKRIISVNYSMGDKRYSINPDIVVFSAGTLGTPLLVKKLLDAMGHSYEQIGTGLADHPMGFVGKVKFKKEYAKLIKKFSLLDKGDYICRTAIRLKSLCGKYTCCAFFRPAFTMENKLPIYKYKSLLGASSGIDRIKNSFSTKLFHPDILAEIFSHMFGVSIPNRVYNILMIMEQKRGSNRISFDGANLIVDWCLTEKELSIYNEMLKKLYTMLLAISDDLKVQIPITDNWLWSAAHHSGTIPLGNKADDLIDKDLKLTFCNNAFVCDGSVIQEHSYANTGLTIGQLSMRLSERVLK